MPGQLEKHSPCGFLDFAGAVFGALLGGYLNPGGEGSATGLFGGWLRLRVSVSGSETFNDPPCGIILGWRGKQVQREIRNHGRHRLYRICAWPSLVRMVAARRSLMEAAESCDG